LNLKRKERRLHCSTKKEGNTLNNTYIMSESKDNWADLAETESEFVGIKTTDGPEDANGVKERTVIEYITDPDTGKRTKITKKFKVYKKTIKVNPRQQARIAARRKLKKFGACEGKPAGPEAGVTAISDPAELETILRRKERRAISSFVKPDPSKLGSWAPRAASVSDDPSKPSTPLFRGEDAEPQLRQGAANGPDLYVPPIRGAGKGQDDRGGYGAPKDDTTTVRVTNLSEDTREEDLKELFKPFGPIGRVYLGVDKITKMARGFAFINFLYKEDAAKAIEKLNGHGYAHLILSVEWAKPSRDGQ